MKVQVKADQYKIRNRDKVPKACKDFIKELAWSSGAQILILVGIPARDKVALTQ